MRNRFLLGPAGSGKTFRCLTEIRHALSVSQEGAPLLLVAPKQTTYQLERQFLEYASIPGYTRLFILSFERLAHFIFESAGKPSPRLLDEEGRIMVLRSLLVRSRDQLRIFRASSKLTGFAQQLSLVLGELRRQQVSASDLRKAAANVAAHGGLEMKLSDLATLLERYDEWLDRHQLKDSDCLLNAATGFLRQKPARPAGGGTDKLPAPAAVNAQAPGGRIGSRGRKAKAVASDQLALSLDPPSGNGSPNGAGHSGSGPVVAQISGLWIDGFGELSAQELDFAASLAPYCNETTVTLCLESVPVRRRSWLSSWSAVERSFEEARKHFEAVGGASVQIEIVRRDTDRSRFHGSEILRHLEQHWEQPIPYEIKGQRQASVEKDGYGEVIRIVSCENPEAEAIFAAREILKHARGGGRFRDVAVLVRKLENYYDPLQRVFARYQIPFFLDRRESVAHHPLAELTRSALRTVALQWQHEDWFAALKSGLIGADEGAIDELENEALARGWKGRSWREPLKIRDRPKSIEERERLIALETRMEKLRGKIMPPFDALAQAVVRANQQPNGPELAAAIRDFWQELGVENTLVEWAQEAGPEAGLPSAVHTTVWTQMNGWLDNIETAFASEPLSLRQWLPILEAGLSQLTVGIIPPALDQVLIGALDRSRNPDIRLALLLGMNETVFPAAPENSMLLTESDRNALEGVNLFSGSTTHYQLGRERFYAYVACTRARERVILSCALNSADGAPLNPSPFLGQIKALFPGIEVESFSQPIAWEQSAHLNELMAPLLKLRTDRAHDEPAPKLRSLPAVETVLRELEEFRPPVFEEKLAPDLAEQLYGPIFHTSVSRLEQYAACPFKFFVHSGLRAEERRVFELDFKERGTFQHDALALFHQQLEAEHKRWRDLTPPEARARMGQIARSLVMTYREGLLQSTEEAKFTGEILIESLQNFIEVLVGWMQGQYLFNPVKVELPFGQEDGSSPWVIELAGGHRLALNGRIDRVDVWTDPNSGRCWGVVLDYKSSHKQLDPVLLEHGIQLQLVAYLNVLRNWPDASSFPEARDLVPAGVFYVSLRGKYSRSRTRTEALSNTDEDRKLAYRHSGRFDSRALPLLDARPNVFKGDQFNFRHNQDGSLNKGSREVLESPAFSALLDSVEQNLRRMGTEIFSGRAAVSPFRKGLLKACDQCVCQAVCRIDPWEHPFRVLRGALNR